MKIGNREFQASGHTYVMGILNVTPDSFSDGGSYNLLEKAVEHAKQMIEDGADIIDVGGESTRPNYTQITEDEEIKRVVPIIRAIKEIIDIPVSVDTYKSRVAKEAIHAGADLVNDIWGLKYDAAMSSVIKEAGAAVCLMHNRRAAEYTDFLKELVNDLAESVEIANKAGIPADKIMVDPGIGFAKTLQMNLSCVKHLEMLRTLNYPILLGTSRKSMIGLTLNLPVTEREEGTLATTVLAVMKGCQFVRVHDVKANKRAIAMTEAILNGE